MVRRVEILLTVALVLGGCGRESPPSEPAASRPPEAPAAVEDHRPAPVPLTAPDVGPARRVKLTPVREITSRPDAPYRWLDALDRPYAERYRRSYSYEDARAIFEYKTRGSTFQATLEATDLKPNFAYQVKLVGKPTSRWKDAGDDAANRRLGKLGRWWRPGPYAGNVYYYYYDGEQNEPDDADLEGYILFDFFVTDSRGGASVALKLDSSFHVLWKTSQWPRGSRDPAERTYPVVVAPGSKAYARAFPPDEVSIYAESQYGRAEPGQAVMPPGRYQCLFVLTEESFHAWDDEGGDWAAALGGDVEFTIVGAEQQGGATASAPRAGE